MKLEKEEEWTEEYQYQHGNENKYKPGLPFPLRRRVKKYKLGLPFPPVFVC